MSPAIVMVLFFGALLLLLAFGLPTSFTLGGLSVLFTILIWGPERIGFVIQRAYEALGASSLVAMPAFILMADLLQSSGLADDLYEAMYRWLGRVPGGLAMGTVLICTAIAAMSGIAGAGVVIMGIIAFPAMMKRGYDKSMAIGCILAGGVLGNLIPPSCSFIILGSMARISIARLFAGGIIPGLILSSLYIAYIGIRCRIQPSAGPPISEEERFTWKEKFASLRSVILPVVVVVAVLGSIFTGIASPTEASAVGVVAVIVCAIIHRRFSWKTLKTAVYDAFIVNGMIMWIIIGAFCFGAIFTAVGAPQLVKDFVGTLALSPKQIVMAMQGTYLFFGCFLDDVTMIAITIPAYLPIIEGLGLNTLWFGILWQINMQVAYLTPPFGYCLFYFKGVAPPEIAMGDIYRSIGPFVALQVLGLVLVWLVPQLALWVPETVFGLG